MYLLQLHYTGTDLIGIIVVIVLVLSIQVVILRLTFRVDTRVKYQRETIWLLMKLCEKQGLSKEELDNFKKNFNLK